MNVAEDISINSLQDVAEYFPGLSSVLCQPWSFSPPYFSTTYLASFDWRARVFGHKTLPNLSIYFRSSDDATSGERPLSAQLAMKIRKQDMGNVTDAHALEVIGRLFNHMAEHYGLDKGIWSHGPSHNSYSIVDTA